MKISYNWLKQFIAINWPADKTAALLTDLGLEVEGIDQYEAIKGGLQGVVAGHILSCKKHPNADRLKLVDVDLGNDTAVQIVCGAPNVAAGQKVAVATPGTVLYDKEAQPWKIKKSSIRGEQSNGMICSETELGIGKNDDGILVLDSAVLPGTPCNTLFSIENDTVFEIGLTPNRADAMSHFGVARDLRAGLIRQNVTTALITPSVSSFHVDNRTSKIDVVIENHQSCPRYCGITISGLKVSTSPDWLRHRLLAIGITPKNNVVDVTNYVLHELGQPLHAFDASSISGDKIVVKHIEKGTKFVALDGVEYILDQEDLMICDSEKPLCIAGIFGGINSGVNEQTTRIFLESAYFNPVLIRKTAKRHGLHTDASFRFERGIDINTTEYALLRAAILIQEIAGGAITSDIVDIYPKKTNDFQVFLSFDKIYKLVGQEIPEEIIKQILTSLEIKINNSTETGLGLTIPSYRVDVHREADVIEEILRVYGYNNIAVTDKLRTSVAKNSSIEDHKVQSIIGDQLASQGFYEIMTNSLITSEYRKLFKTSEKEQHVTMLNPLSNDLAEMRTDILFSGLEALAYNLNRQQSNLKVFEFAKTYHSDHDVYEEQKHLSIMVTGNQYPESWEEPVQKSNFFYIKSIVVNVLERLGIQYTKSSSTKSDLFSECLSLYVNDTKLTAIGVVRQHILKHFNIKQQVLFADLNWDIVLDTMKPKTIISKSVNRFPKVRRDLSLLIDKDITFEAIRDVAAKTHHTLIKEINLFDVYEGENLPEGKKSYALSFIVQNEKKTLNDSEIDSLMKKLQHRLEKQLGAELRS